MLTRATLGVARFGRRGRTRPPKQHAHQYQSRKGMILLYNKNCKYERAINDVAQTTWVVGGEEQDTQIDPYAFLSVTDRYILLKKTIEQLAYHLVRGIKRRPPPNLHFSHRNRHALCSCGVYAHLTDPWGGGSAPALERG